MEQKTPSTTRAPRKRFRIEKLEERIAPKATKKGGGGKGGASSASGTSTFPGSGY